MAQKKQLSELEEFSAYNADGVTGYSNELGTGQRGSDAKSGTVGTESGTE